MPINPSSYLIYQIKQIPVPAPSKSNGGAAGSARILSLSSVIIHPPFVPTEFITVTLIGSGFPSTQIFVLSVVLIVPPETASRITVINASEISSQNSSPKLEIGSPIIGLVVPLALQP